jgi:hypothetical protein
MDIFLKSDFALKELMQRELLSIREEIVAERRIVDERFKAMIEAANKESIERARRDTELNHAHEQARDKERDFIGREVFESFTSASQLDRSSLREQIHATAIAASAAREQMAKLLSDQLYDQNKTNDIRFARLEKNYAMLYGALIFIGVLLGAIEPIVIYILSRHS